MSCHVREQLKREFGEATLDHGRYSESLEGVARTSEHQRELERLDQLVNASREALLRHERQHHCQREQQSS